jgi:hypothetical protein
MDNRSSRSMTSFFVSNIGLRGRGLNDPSVTVELAPVDGVPATQATQMPDVKTEGEPKPSTSRKKAAITTTKTRIKREMDAGMDEFDDEEEVGDERVNLAELSVAGGPISSRRKDDRIGRGWRKIELWIEEDEAEEIVIDDDGPSTSQPDPRSIRIKIEDEPMEDIIMPIADEWVREDSEDLEEKMKLATKSRTNRRRREVKGKSREEKEEVAREELDLEVLRDQFAGEDGTEVYTLSFI